MAKGKEKKAEFNPIDMEISITPLLDAIDGLRQTQDKKLAKVERKYRNLKAKIDAKRKRIELEKKIAALEAEEAKL